MRVLLLYKNSTFENYFLSDPKRLTRLKGLFNPFNFKRFLVTHERHYQALDLVHNAVKARGLDCHRSARGKKIDYSRFSLIITVGGDGTFLEASRGMKNQLILGVNSDPLWSVGRFCVANIHNFEQILDKFLAGKAKARSYQRMRITLSGKRQSWTALNDCLICHQNPAAMTRYYIKLGRAREEHRSSGVWIATAAGSTGAMHSAGGKVLAPHNKNMQYMPRELYKGLRTDYKLQGGLIKPGQTLTITSMIREGMIYLDGSHAHLPFAFGQSAKITLSDQPLKAVDA